MEIEYSHTKWPHAVLFNSLEHLKRFQSYLIKLFYISFTKENEIIPEQGTFITSA